METWERIKEKMNRILMPKLTKKRAKIKMKIKRIDKCS